MILAAFLTSLYSLWSDAPEVYAGVYEGGSGSRYRGRKRTHKGAERRKCSAVRPAALGVEVLEGPALRTTFAKHPLDGVTTRKCSECTTSGTNEERHTAVPSELQPTCAAIRLRNDGHFQQRRSSRFKWDSRVRCRGSCCQPADLGLSDFTVSRP